MISLNYIHFSIRLIRSSGGVLIMIIFRHILYLMIFATSYKVQCSQSSENKMLPLSVSQLAVYGSYGMAAGVVMGISGALIELYFYPKKYAMYAILATLQQKLNNIFASHEKVGGVIHKVVDKPIARLQDKNEPTFHKPGVYLLVTGAVITACSWIMSAF